MKLGEVSYPCVLQFHQVSSKSDEKQKSFINSPFFCSEFQSVNRIVKIVHSGLLYYTKVCILKNLHYQLYPKLEFVHTIYNTYADTKIVTTARMTASFCPKVSR